MVVRPPVALTAVMLLASAGCLTTTISGVGSASSGTAGTTGGAGTTTTGTGTGASLIGFGPCTSDNQCASGVCGIDGTGHCCRAVCTSFTPPCGATDCDGETGACIFPDGGISCGSPACAGDVLSNPSFCDGAGDCAPNVTGCAPYACESAACLTSCETGAQCAGGSFCDALNAACCSGLAAGGTIEVDSDRGYDRHACCGIGANQPCQTITQAMKLIDSAQAPDVTIEATVFFDGGLWDKDGTETYPIVLGWGAELSAAGVIFDDDGFAAEVFDIESYSPSDTVGYASITGTPALPVAIDLSATTIQVEGGSHLYLANADLNSGGGVYLQPLASLTLGRDRSGLIEGTVAIGVKDPLVGSPGGGGFGILCFSDDAGNGCTIDDAALDGGSSVIIQNQYRSDISASDGASISLTSAPIVGEAPNAPGFQQCPSKNDTSGNSGGFAAITLLGKATMTFQNGTVQCIQRGGFGLESSPIGSPTLTIQNSLIQNTSAAIGMRGGSLTVASSTIRFNEEGVESDSDAGVDLSGGPFGGVNTIACNSWQEIGQSPGGFSVGSYGVHAINASNVAWDTPDPNVFVYSADTGYGCTVADCVALGDAGFVLDAVSFDSSPGIITTGNTLSPLKCE